MKNKNTFQFNFFALGISFLLAAGQVHAEADYGVTFYPTSAHWNEENNQWVVPIRAYVYNEKIRSPIGWIASWFGSIYAWLERREDLQEIERSEIDPDDPDDIADRALMKERSRPFLVKGKRNQVMLLTLADRVWTLDPSNNHGHIGAELRLDLAEFSEPSNEIRELFYDVRSDEDAGSRYRGNVYLVPPSGISVVSDIDDTIKYSEVLDREELFENTLLYPFYSIQGMAEWYQHLDHCGAAFHYVSKSPWQLYRPLADFLAEKGFPGGSFYLRHQKTLGLKALWKIKGPSKKEYIRELMTRYPKRDFILIGDSTQEDPAIYADISREFPGQVRHIFIRKVKRKNTYLTDSLKAFKDLDQSIWTVFKEPQDIAFDPCEPEMKS